MFAIVINVLGYKVEFVSLNEDKSPQFYELNKGEQVIEKDWQIANDMLKPKWDFDNEVWEETATEEEIEASKPPQIDICPPKTVEQRLKEAEQKLAESEEEKKLLKAQVEVLSNTTDFHEELIAEMASKVYA